MKPFIGIKRIWYGEAMTTALTLATLKTWFAADTTKEVLNSHEGTWQYSQDDPSVTDYINELTGKPYYRDATDQGNKTINFTIGQYEFADKAELQGGTLLTEGEGSSLKTIGWVAPTAPELIYKAIVGLTKTGNFVIFTNAAIVGKTDTQEKNLGLGVSAVAMEAEGGNPDEYWLDGDKLTITETGGKITNIVVKA